MSSVHCVKNAALLQRHEEKPHHASRSASVAAQKYTFLHEMVKISAPMITMNMVITIVTMMMAAMRYLMFTELHPNDTSTQHILGPSAVDFNAKMIPECLYYLDRRRNNLRLMSAMVQEAATTLPWTSSWTLAPGCPETEAG
jgi:hypothetical protein